MSLADRLDEFTSRQGIVSAEWCKLLDEVEKLQEQNKTMREALEFYADRNNWEDDNIDLSDTESRKEIFNGTTLNYYEGGKRAREALAKVKQ